jgi:peptide subunit release factor 1 (eRF1)
LKRLYVAIAILIILPSLIIANQFYLKGTTDNMTEIINKAEDNAKQYKNVDAKNDVKKFGQTWEANNKIIATFVRHSELDNINQSNARLMPFLENNDLTSFSAECEVIKAQLHHIMHTEEFSLDNIF